MKTPLKDTPTIGTRRSLTHLNKGSQPHEWCEVDWPVYDDEMGKKLRAKRKELDLTLREASRLLGVSAVVVSALEMGKQVPADGYTIDDVISELERLADER